MLYIILEHVAIYSIQCIIIILPVYTSNGLTTQQISLEDILLMGEEIRELDIIVGPQL